MSIGRNEPCPCGSGKKYKKCCLERDEAQARQYQRAALPALGEDDYIAELRPEIDEAVDGLLLRVEQGRLENVEAELDTLLDKYPEYHMTNYAMGVFLAAERGEPERAIPFFQKAVRIFPPLAEAHYNLGSCYLKRALIAEAVDSFRKAIRYSSGDDGIAGKAQGQIQTLERIVKSNPPYHSLEACLESQRLFDRGFEHLQSQRYAAAVESFNQVLAKNPTHVQSHGNVALAYAGLGQKALALEHLDKGLELDPTYEPARQNRKVIERMREGEPHGPLAIMETHYYRERLEAERSSTRPSWWQKLKRLGGD